MLNLDNYYSDDRFMGYTGNRINMSINKIKINSGMFTSLIINNTSENVNENNISENSSLLFHTEFNNTLSGVSLPFSFDTKASNFSNMRFYVGYDANTKAVVINTKVNELGINAGGLNVNVKAVNIDCYNYVNLREITKALGREVDVVNGEIVIR